MKILLQPSHSGRGRTKSNNLRWNFTSSFNLWTEQKVNEGPVKSWLERLYHFPVISHYKHGFVYEAFFFHSLLHYSILHQLLKGLFIEYHEFSYIFSIMYKNVFVWTWCSEFLSWIKLLYKSRFHKHIVNLRCSISFNIALKAQLNFKN